MHMDSGRRKLTGNTGFNMVDRPKLYQMTDCELVKWAITIRDPLLTTDLEVELLKRFMELSKVTLEEALNPPLF